MRPHHQNSVCAERCELSCDWPSTLADRAGTSGRALARHSAAAELEAGGADTHSRSPRARSRTRTYNNKGRAQSENKRALRECTRIGEAGTKYAVSSLGSHYFAVRRCLLLQQVLGQPLRGQEGRETGGEEEPTTL